MDSCLLMNVFCIYMNQNVIQNTAYNYLSSYKLSMEYLEEMKKLVAESTKTKFYLCKRLWEWVATWQSSNLGKMFVCG